MTDFHANFGNDFFNFKSDETAHVGELMLQYQISEKTPITLTASALIYGADKKISSIDPITGMINYSNDNNYSIYFEASYLYTFANQTTINFFTGVVPTESAFYAVDDFSLINLGLKASKEIKINENFSLPIHLSISSNPDAKNVFYVFGISL